MLFHTSLHITDMQQRSKLWKLQQQCRLQNISKVVNLKKKSFEDDAVFKRIMPTELHCFCGTGTVLWPTLGLTGNLWYSSEHRMDKNNEKVCLSLSILLKTRSVNSTTISSLHDTFTDTSWTRTFANRSHRNRRSGWNDTERFQRRHAAGVDKRAATREKFKLNSELELHLIKPSSYENCKGSYAKIGAFRAVQFAWMAGNLFRWSRCYCHKLVACTSYCSS